MRYDDTEIKGMVEDVAGEVEDLTDRVSGDEDRISSAESRLDAVEEEIENIDDITIPTLVPTTTNFIAGEKYTIHTAIERVANLFAGYWNYIKTNITDLIPSTASKDNQLADKSFVNETVAQNAANFRGNWSDWNSVPTDANLYPADYSGKKTPTNNDYLVVTDASGYGENYDGSWRFLYTGDWNTVGKSGWSPAYRIGSAFTEAQQAAIDSTITSTKVATYDSYEARIGANETNKVDKINTANKVYGTDSQGFQIGYEAGDNVQFANGKIYATDTVYDDTALSNRIAGVESDRIRFYKPTGIAAKTSSPYTCSQYVIADSEQFVPVDGMTIKVRIPVAGNGTYGTAIVVMVRNIQLYIM